MAIRQSYPIVTLFIVIAVCALLLSVGLGHVDWNTVTVEGVQSVVAFGFAMGMVGALVGLHSWRRRRGFFRGGMVGMLLGLVLGPLLFVAEEDLTRIVTLEVLGSFALIVLGVLARVAKSDPLWEPIQPMDDAAGEQPA